MLAGLARRVEVVLTVQREGVEPERHALERAPSLGGIGVDHDLVGDLAFRGPWNRCFSLLTHLDRREARTAAIESTPPRDSLPLILAPLSGKSGPHVPNPSFEGRDGGAQLLAEVGVA